MNTIKILETPISRLIDHSKSLKVSTYRAVQIFVLVLVADSLVGPKFIIDTFLS